MRWSSSLDTARLRLVPFSPPYLTERYVAWLNDPAVVRYSEQRHRSHSLDSCRNYLNGFEGTANEFWVILRRDGNPAHIGNITAIVDENNGLADVAILVGEKLAWGQGLGTEAWITVCRYLLEERNMRKVTAGTLTSNRGMIGIMQRAGMIEDGRRSRHYLVDGEEVDMVYSALFRGMTPGKEAIGAKPDISFSESKSMVDQPRAPGR